jgi:hypothetical protein
MKSLILASAGMLALFVSGRTCAQTPYSRPGGYAPSPTVSPYLNLLRPGSRAINYYDLVRPQQQFTGAIQQLQGEVALNQQAVSDLQGLPVLTTGHRTRFMSYSQYFQNIGGQTVSGSSPFVSATRPGLRNQSFRAAPSVSTRITGP